VESRRGFTSNSVGSSCGGDYAEALIINTTTSFVSNHVSHLPGGARQVECTINGIGERAGNAALEEIVMALQVRKKFYNPRFGRDPDSDTALTNINTKEIYKSSRLVSTLTGGSSFARESDPCGSGDALW